MPNISADVELRGVSFTSPNITESGNSVFLEFLCVSYVVYISFCAGKISFTNLKHREVHWVTVPLPLVLWILFEDVRGFSSGLDIRTNVPHPVPERLLTKLFPMPWGVTTVAPNTYAYRNQSSITHYTKHLRAGQSPVFSYLSGTFTYFWNFIFTPRSLKVLWQVSRLKDLKPNITAEKKTLSISHRPMQFTFPFLIIIIIIIIIIIFFFCVAAAE
jgi:hypothetical protein